MINLDTAEPGHEYLTRHGKVMTYLARNDRNNALPHILVTDSGQVDSYTDAGLFHSIGHHSGMDLVSRTPDAGGS
jgi:hypothetical protein